MNIADNPIGPCAHPRRRWAGCWYQVRPQVAGRAARGRPGSCAGPWADESEGAEPRDSAGGPPALAVAARSPGTWICILVTGLVITWTEKGAWVWTCDSVPHYLVRPLPGLLAATPLCLGLCMQDLPVHCFSCDPITPGRLAGLLPF